MAGLGRKIFNSGDILLASEVQGFLQDQAVMVFDDSATRATAIGTANFSEGMVTYTKDDDAIQVFDGTSFVPVGSEPGLVHINSTSFSAVSSISLPDDTFTSSFTNYKIIVNFSASGTLTPQIRLRAGGTDNSGATSYRYSGFRVTAANSTAISPFSTGDSKWAFGSVISGNFGDYFILELKSPKETVHTKFMAEQQADENFGSRYMHGGTFTATTSFDSLSFIASANNITGTIKAYGYKD